MTMHGHLSREEQFMNFFDIMLKLNHPNKKTGWVETTASFTGAVRSALKRKRVDFYQHELTADFNEFEIYYYTDSGRQTGWYSFNPLPGPEPEDISGMQIRIRYQKSRPWNFEVITDNSDDI